MTAKQKAKKVYKASLKVFDECECRSENRQEYLQAANACWRAKSALLYEELRELPYFPR